MICKGCIHTQTRGDFVRCKFWGRIVATWGMGMKWIEVDECSARQMGPEEGTT